MPEIAAVLVDYNAGDELVRALESIAAELKGRSWEGVVVDNASNDESTAGVAAFAPTVRLIRNAANVGFGTAVNQGIAATTAPLVLIMNPDARLEPGAVAGLEAVLAAHDACALVGPRILNPDGSVQGSARGDPDMLTGLFGRRQALTRLFPWLPVSRRNVIDPATLPPGESHIVDWLSGACVLGPRAAFERVGGFDERYFLYWEDADLCRRLRQHGLHVRYVPSATAVHRVGHSSRTAQAASIRAFHASARLYYDTHVAPGRLNPLRAVARVLLALRQWWHLRRLTL